MARIFHFKERSNGTDQITHPITAFPFVDLTFPAPKSSIFRFFFLYFFKHLGGNLTGKRKRKASSKQVSGGSKFMDTINLPSSSTPNFYSRLKLRCKWEIEAMWSVVAQNPIDSSLPIALDRWFVHVQFFTNTYKKTWFDECGYCLSVPILTSFPCCIPIRIFFFFCN